MRTLLRPTVTLNPTGGCLSQGHRSATSEQKLKKSNDARHAKAPRAGDHPGSGTVYRWLPFLQHHSPPVLLAGSSHAGLTPSRNTAKPSTTTTSDDSMAGPTVGASFVRHTPFLYSEETPSLNSADSRGSRDQYAQNVSKSENEPTAWIDSP